MEPESAFSVADAANALFAQALIGLIEFVGVRFAIKQLAFVHLAFGKS